VPLLSWAISFYLSARTFPTVIASLIRPFGVPFRVTPKGKDNHKEAGDQMAVWGLAALIVITVGGIVVGCRSPAEIRSPDGVLISTCWALCNLVLFAVTLLAVVQRPRLRGEDRFPIGRPGCLVAKGRRRTCTVVDLSLSGAILDNIPDLKLGEPVKFSLDGLGAFDGTVVRKAGNKTGIHFLDVPEASRDKLIVYLYASGLCNGVQETSPFRVLWRLLTKAMLKPA
jgi:cellulose synthase (UDP-forming)